MTPADGGAAGVTLYREIDALGGTASTDWGAEYVYAIGDVLAILERRGFGENIEAAPVSPDHDALVGDALASALSFLRMFHDSGVELLGEGVHAGLRKGTAAADAGHLYDVIAKSKTTAWWDAIAFAHSPFFSMWGGDRAISLLNKAIAARVVQR